jgi:L-amino acid N-acyltransferase YncA
MKIKFVPYKLKYLNFITRLYNDYVLNSTSTYHIKPLSSDEVYQYFQLKNSRTFAFVIASEKLNEEIGFCLIKPFSQKQGYFYTGEITIYLRNAFLGRGIGQKCVDYLEDVAKENNYHVIIAAVCSINTGSIRLFEKRGYKRCGHFKQVGYKFDKKLDDIYFQRIL